MKNEQLKSFVRQWGPDILSGLATVGVGVTAYFSGRAAVKAERKKSFKEKAKCYIPTILSGLVTIGSIWGSRKLSAKQLASVAAATGYLISKAKNNQGGTTAKTTPGVSVEETGTGDVLCLESFSGRWFRASIESVEEACQNLDTIYHHGFEEKGYCDACLNDLYSLLGIQTTYFGDKVFWTNENNGEHIIFANSFKDLDNGLGEVYVIELAEESMPTMMRIDY